MNKKRRVSAKVKSQNLKVKSRLQFPTPDSSTGAHLCAPTTPASSGFTILEALIAIAILSILMTAIAPVFVLAVGNRLQARRIELATQATKTYIAGVKAGTIAPPQHIVVLNEVDSNKNFNSQREQFVATAPPSTSGGLRCTNVTVGNSYCWNNTTSSLYCFDLDGGGCSSDSGQDLVIQAFRSASSEARSMDKAYILGIRVYRAAGFSDLSPLVASDANTQRTQLTFSGGLGNFKTPLVETATEVANDESSINDFCDRLGCE
ncbi:prepilin-type cleavage/methylation domain-containing protein [Chroococcidiopsis sp. CCALA 051]|uniref:hormogonium polysaccharide secretion pseudopilin HpsB n=1 Tax=Chroococcidiopsis sp. CCALA 051 TaxID=869949 RepID=UPI000D0CCEE2|nr:hormogonium polysaccharide secretion pseudopilin HpsB [Chroococcidiopsis sp. CCALA 051]PSM46246.1 prepilin-type cleavage/methylation domain-containing protein [Chroococcidiopsis sp. CCALA 051]